MKIKNRSRSRVISATESESEESERFHFLPTPLTTPTPTLVKTSLNLFMGHHERIWLENYNASSILFYRRYVDDTFCLFDTEHDATLFFDYINDRHPNIRFTMEKEMDKKIPFLDVLIDNSQPLPPIKNQGQSQENFDRSIN